MTIEKKLDMVIEMVAHMNEEMTEKFTQIDEKFARIDERFDRIDERFERVEERLTKVEEQLERVDERLTNVEGNLETLRNENAKEHALLHSKIAEVAEAVNNSNAMHEERFAALERKDAELARVQDLHSTEILKLQAG